MGLMARVVGRGLWFILFPIIMVWAGFSYLWENHQGWFWFAIILIGLMVVGAISSKMEKKHGNEAEE